MEKITDVLFSEVRTESGKRLGRLFDLRCEGEPEHGPPNENRPVTEIIYGTTGLWEVLGLKKLDLKSTPWKSVKSIEPGKIVVADDHGG